MSEDNHQQISNNQDDQAEDQPNQLQPLGNSTQPPSLNEQSVSQSSIEGKSQSISFPPTPPPAPPLIPTSTTQVVSKKAGGGGGFKKFLLVFVLMGILVAGGGFGLWWWLNRPADTTAEVTINYWGLWESDEVMKPIFDQYMQANPHVIINYTNSSPEEYRQRLINRLSAETPEVDMFRFHNTWVPMLRPYLSPMPDWVYSNEEFNQIFYPVMQRDLKSGVNYVGIPLMFDGLSLFYNEDLFIAAGENPPTDWTEFRRLAKELTVVGPTKEIEIAGAAMGSTTNVDHWPDIVSALMYQGGANPAQPASKAGEEALTFYSLATKVDKVWANYLPNSTLYFALGKLAMYFGPAWRIPNINQLAEENAVNLRYKVIPIPQLPNTNQTWASYWVEGVSNKSDSQVQTAAWDLLAYLSKAETLEQFYQLQTQTRGIGMPFSRVDLADQLKSHPQLGAYIIQAPAAKSWYLSSNTTDKEGLNDRIIGYYKDAVNEAEIRGVTTKSLQNTQKGVETVLQEYGL